MRYDGNTSCKIDGIEERNDLQDDDQAQWRALWVQYLDFNGFTLDATVHDRTWALLLNEAEPMHGALALAGGEAVGFVHYIFRRSTRSLSDSF
ncbi:hypothetical protein NKI01_24125 [Mesorhizobium sp. M0815]|uniref:hypothetical protein n=1 Tax=Mesorhizobium sp. M0815 TaxID=2957005 RepID=UPI003337BD8E